MANDELNWVMGVVGPTNIAVSCGLDDTSTLHRWVDSGVEPDPRSVRVVSLLYDELAGIVDAGNLGVLFHLVSAAAAVYDQDGVESLLRSSYSGVSSREVLCLLRSVDDRDKLLLYEIIERLQHDA